MCKLSNLFVVDLYDSTASGGIEWNVMNSAPRLMNNPCKIVVKQITTELKDTASSPSADISTVLYLRVIHNINIQSGSNGPSTNSNVLAFIDSFQARNTLSTTNMTGFTTADCILYAPAGLPAILKLNRAGVVTNPSIVADAIVDAATLMWNIRLEITINPDEE